MPPWTRARAQAKLRSILAILSDIQTRWSRFSAIGSSESERRDGTDRVKVYGNDLDTLDGAAANITTVLSKLPGIVDLQFKRQTRTPSISIEMQPQTLAASGHEVQDVLETIDGPYAGATVGQTFQGLGL